MAEINLPDDGPEFEVWNHLYSGVELARSEADVLSPESKRLLEAVGKVLSRGRLQFLLDSRDHDLLKDFGPLLENPWIKHATEIEIAWEGVGRLGKGLARFLELRPVLTKYTINERERDYLEEVVNVYIYGFFGATLAMAGATLEQVLTRTLDELGLISREKVRKKRIGAGKLLQRANSEGLLVESQRLADRILRSRNRVMHRHMWDSRIAQRMALRSIDDLGAILAELGRTKAERTHGS